MTFDMLKKLRTTSSQNPDKGDVVKGDMSKDDSETSRCCDLSLIDENSENDESEPTMESKLMELQDDLKAKTSQCTILRDTLSTMSATMRRQEFQLEEKISEIEQHLKTIEEKNTECTEWKRRCQYLESEVEKLKNSPSASDVQSYLNAINEKTAECDEWKSKYEALVFKIESGINASEKLHLPQHHLNNKVSSSPFNVSERRPWKGERNTLATTMCHDENSTTSDSIDDPYIDTGIRRLSNPKRSPRRSAKAKRAEKKANELTVNSKLNSIPSLEAQQIDSVGHQESLLNFNKSEEMNQQQSDSGESNDSLFDFVNHNDKHIAIPTGSNPELDTKDSEPDTTESSTNGPISNIEESVSSGDNHVVVDEIENLSPDNSDGELLREQFDNTAGFSFVVEVPFSDPESDSNQAFRGKQSYQNYPSILQLSKEDAFDSSKFVGSIDLEKSMHEVELLSLNHFIELYDKYKIDEVEDIKCEVDLARDKDEDNISVVSFASMDSSVPAVDRSFASSSLNGNKITSDTNQFGAQKLEKQREKDARRLRKRIIRTAKREAERAQFNCEVVEC